MGAHRIDPRRARLHRCYTIEETARLLGVHRNTVRNWLSGGLAVIDDVRPFLIRGEALKAFLDARRKTARRPCPPGALYCFRCRDARRPAMGMADFIAREAGAGNIRALCEACGTVMNRRAREASLSVILPGLEVRILREGGDQPARRSQPSEGRFPPSRRPARTADGGTATQGMGTTGNDPAAILSRPGPLGHLQPRALTGT